ncbi:MAG TPA: sigma-70 family RNA polymerase sigma factor [Euzebyales bacterium]|nr:sigma-70 family RNA polymerase sigma factor [Euzebyales bacterium]
MTAKAVQSVRALHDDYAGPLYVFAYRRLGDKQAAEEVVQDTLVRAWRSADSYDADRGPVAAWLFTIARNLIVDHTRRRAARPTTVGLPAVVPEPSGEIDRMLETWQVADALSGLSTQHREAILMCHYRGHTIAEAAALLGVPDGTVKSRLHYALRALRLRLEEMGVVG